MSQRIQNLYIARLTTNERPCYICSKFTAVVLTLADNSNLDWFYICRSHLGDTNFCTRVGGSSGTKSAPSSPRAKKRFEDRPPESDSVSDLVASIGSAWNSWRKKPSQDDDDKTSKDKKDGEDGDKRKSDDGDKKDAKEKQDNEDKQKGEDHKDDKTEEPTTPKSPQQPVRFVLNRDYFYMRQREYTRKIQKKEATDKLKDLEFPEVPKTQPK
ncbi:VPS4-associated protein 1 [Zychaea mexicana]|uniref:VPS4-associated protein 1 n=1 Tax=Zychaea mexicana TaxID=64656 RepID=UPI0022FDCB0B|nr:VPS4-associated protein 1 [Zychaea mexicana]KAI9495718.1 VPS4-associated protein 1 [Zychaea mexicana]